MKKLIVALFVLLSQNIFAQSGWQRVNFDSKYKLTNVYFFNETTGIVTGYCDEVIFPYSVNAKVFRTTNGGVNWNSVGGSGFGIVSDINFFNSSYGFYSTDGPGLNIIMYTSNGGANWHGSIRENSHDSYQTLYCSSIINNVTAYAGSKQGKILKTTNSGINWDYVITTPFSSNVGKIAFYDNLTGYVFDESFFESYKTTDGGATWQPSLSPGFVKKINYLSQDTLIALASNSYYRSSNGGATWQGRSLGASIDANDMYYFNRSKIVAVGSGVPGAMGVVNVTTNGGVNWISTAVDNSQALNAVSFGSSNVGFAVGDSGRIYKTITGGITNINEQPETPLSYSLSQNYPNPFNPSTRINYELRNSNYVTLKVFNLLGKEVAQLINEKQNAGSYAVDFNSTEFNLPSGIYFYTLSAGEFKETRKMVLIK
jgi:photosystem II stability/assembly factor-like uncharacterized protein